MEHISFIVLSVCSLLTSVTAALICLGWKRRRKRNRSIVKVPNRCRRDETEYAIPASLRKVRPSIVRRVTQPKKDVSGEVPKQSTVITVENSAAIYDVPRQIPVSIQFLQQHKTVGENDLYVEMCPSSKKARLSQALSTSLSRKSSSFHSEEESQYQNISTYAELKTKNVKDIDPTREYVLMEIDISTPTVAQATLGKYDGYESPNENKHIENEHTLYQKNEFTSILRLAKEKFDGYQPAAQLGEQAWPEAGHKLPATTKDDVCEDILEGRRNGEDGYEMIVITGVGEDASGDTSGYEPVDFDVPSRRRTTAALANRPKIGSTKIRRWWNSRRSHSGV